MIGVRVNLRNRRKVSRFLRKVERRWSPRADGVSRYARRVVLTEMRALVPLIKARTPVKSGALQNSVRVTSFYNRRTGGLQAHVGWNATDGGYQKYPVRVQQMLAAMYGNTYQNAFGRKAFDFLGGVETSQANRVERKLNSNFDREMGRAAREHKLVYVRDR